MSRKQWSHGFHAGEEKAHMDNHAAQSGEGWQFEARDSIYFVDQLGELFHTWDLHRLYHEIRHMKNKQEKCC